jgi:RNA polymerase sigma-70 factor, ECF subfamily
MCDSGATLDEPSLAELMRDFSAPLYRYVKRLTFNNCQLAEEVVQETFVRAWQRPDIVNDRYSSIGPWLFTVARNLVNDHKRVRMARPAEVNDAELTNLPTERDPIEETLLAEVVRQAVAKLSPEHRAVICQIYSRDMSFEAAAKRLGIPVGTVKSRTHYALRSLRSIMATIE